MTIPKEYSNVRLFYITKYGNEKGGAMFENYMNRKRPRVRSKVASRAPEAVSIRARTAS